MPIPMQPALILASQSPRRIELLQNAKIRIEIQPAQIDETVDTNLNPKQNAIELARMKACHVSKKFPKRAVLAADTLVTLDDRILGKPADDQDAVYMLKSLSGRSHQVITGFALVNCEGQTSADAVSSTVTFKKLSTATIESYVKTGEPLDKAGSYAIQGLGNALIDSYSGSLSNIIGLPMDNVLKLLSSIGIYPESE